MDTNKKLLMELKKLWGLESNAQDDEALQIISNYIDSSGVDIEEQKIRQKVLLKTREKTEELLQGLENLEARISKT